MKTEYVGICGSDIPRIINGDVPFLPTTLGHEFSGTVVEVGDGCCLSPGDKVLVVPLLVCGECPNCKNGNAGQCVSSKLIGLRAVNKGGFSEYNVIPEKNLIKLSPKFDMVHAAMIEPLTVALHALSLIGFDPSLPIAVIGTGTIGNLVIAAAKAFECRQIYAFGRNDAELELAKTFGAVKVFNTSDSLVLESFSDSTNGIYSPQVVEAVGKEETVNLALELCSVMGNIALIGMPKSEIKLSAYTFYRRLVFRQQHLHGVYHSYTNGHPGEEFPKAINMIENSKIPLDEMIYSIDNMENLLSYFRRIESGEKITGKMLFHF